MTDEQRRKAQYANNPGTGFMPPEYCWAPTRYTPVPRTLPEREGTEEGQDPCLPVITFGLSVSADQTRPSKK